MAADKQFKNPLRGHGFSAGSALLDFAPGVFFNVRGGDSLGTAVMKEIPSTLAFAAAPGAMWGATIASAVPAGVLAYQRADASLASRYNDARKPGTNFTYTDTRQALTMRQAAVQAIQGSKMNARNALGGEAALMHKGYGSRMGI